MPAAPFFVIAREGADRWCALVERGRVTELDVVGEREERLAGAVFRARVLARRPAVDGVFVDLGLARSGLLVGDRTDPPVTSLEAGTILPVQVVRDAEPGKGVRVTRALALAGDRVVCLPGRGGTGVSRRIADAGDRARLERILAPHAGDDLRLVARSAALAVDDEVLVAEATRLAAEARELLARASSAPVPSLLRPAPDPVRAFVRDRLAARAERIVLAAGTSADTEESWPLPVERRRDAGEVLGTFGLRDALREALVPEVPLRGGGRLIVETTAACATVDLDTAGAAAATGPDPALAFDLAALPEIVRQIRLRGLGGTIVVDFLAPATGPGRERLAGAISKALAADPAGARLRHLSPSGLAEIGRRRGGPPLAERPAVRRLAATGAPRR
ncbi:MAG: ribonuclease E/G [Acidobacteriota bacterium]